MPKYLAVLLILAGAIGLAFAVPAWTEQYRMAHIYVPVEAAVISASVPGKGAANLVDAMPRVNYRYQVNGKAYESTRIAIFDDRVDKAGAEAFLKQFAPGKTVTAYADPAHPEQAVVSRKVFSGPYWGTAAALAAGAVGAGALGGIVRPDRRRMLARPGDASEPGGWQELAPSRRIWDLLREKWFLLASVAPAALLAGQLWASGRPLSFGGWTFLACAGMAWVVMVWAIAVAWMATRWMGDPKIFVRGAPMKRGERFSVRMEMEIRRPMEKLGAEIRVICRETIIMHVGRRTMLASRDFGAQAIGGEAPARVAEGAMLLGAGELRFDPECWPASGTKGASSYPVYQWEIQVQVIGARPRLIRFPLRVV